MDYNVNETAGVICYSVTITKFKTGSYYLYKVCVFLYIESFIMWSCQFISTKSYSQNGSHEKQKYLTFWGKENCIHSWKNPLMLHNLVYTFMLNLNIHNLSLQYSSACFPVFFKVTFGISTASTVFYKVKPLGYTCAHKATW